MKVFDLHADIGYDVMQKKQHGICTDIVKTYHVEKLRKGEVQYVCMASFFEGVEDYAYMQEMITSLIKDITLCEDVDIVTDKETLKNENGHIKAILSVEGMCGIREEPREKVRWMWEQGIRIASFCWNEENALATGVKGNPEHGLTDMGNEALDEMIHLGMIVDVSHANEKTFWDIMERSDAHVIATHSNARELCDHPRNLWKEQAIAIIKRKGLVGMNSAPVFIDTDKTKRDVEHLVHHVLYLKELFGNVDGIALGFDFMDFYDDFDSYCEGLPDASFAQNMILELQKQGFTTKEIEQIAYRNAVDYLRNRL